MFNLEQMKSKLDSGSLEFSLIKMNEMPILSSILDKGDIKNIVKGRRSNNPYSLRDCLPNELSVYWAHLDPGEKLITRRHPLASLMIVIEGDGKVQGDSNVSFNTGDSLFIPSWSENDFIAENEGLWLLSIQFRYDSVTEQHIRFLCASVRTVERLPSLRARQIVIGDRAGLTVPESVKSNSAVSHLLPRNVDMCWLQVTSSQSLVAPEADRKRLIIVCSGNGELYSHSRVALNPGTVFWQQDEDLILDCVGRRALWVLFIDINETEKGSEAHNDGW